MANPSKLLIFADQGIESGVAKAALRFFEDRYPPVKNETRIQNERLHIVATGKCGARMKGKT